MGTSLPMRPTAGDSLAADTALSKRYTYVVAADSSEMPHLSAEQLYDMAAAVVFPVSDTRLPIGDKTLAELENEVLPRINSDSLRLLRIVLRGAASPEGPRKFNVWLGQERAKVLYDFVNSRLTTNVPDGSFYMQSEAEDYQTLLHMMRQRNDRDYGLVSKLCAIYLPQGRTEELKKVLMEQHFGLLWQRLQTDYFPVLRAARMVIFYQKEPKKESGRGSQSTLNTLNTPSTLNTPGEQTRLERRELLSVKTNLLFYGVWMPGYNRYCPLPNVAVEYYPKHGHFTYGASFDCPWWQDYWAHKYFQVRNYQVEARYYLRSGDIRKNPPGQGAAFRGLYIQGYGHLGLFGICFDENRGWVGEGVGAGVGIGFVKQLGRKSRWRLEVGLQAGVFVCKYDPYQYENPVNPNYRDHLYYYKWTLEPELFKKRQYRFSWFGPTRIGITLSYDLLFRRIQKRGVSLKSYEISPLP